MRTSGGVVRVACAMAALVLCGGAALCQEGEDAKKPPKKTRSKPVAGVVKTVDIEQKRIVVEVKGQDEKTFVCDAKSSITFVGGIIDGIKAGDTLKITVNPQAENVIRKAVVRRTGGADEKPKKKTKKRKKPTEEETPPEPEEAGW